MSETLWGIDLGGTKIECVALRDGNVLARHRIDTEAHLGYRHILDRIKLVLEQTADLAGAHPGQVGIGTPGTCDPKSGLMRGANTTCLNGQDLLADLRQSLKIDVRIANDANCFALAEAIMGSGQGHRVVFGVIMGTGVGGGVVVDSKVLSGMQGIAGEWGHNQLEPHGLPCYCGRIGCVETVLSGPFLERHFESLTGRRIRLPEIVDLYRQDQSAGKGDSAAIVVINNLIRKFGQAIGPIVNVLDPDAIIIGGGVGNIDELYTLGADAAKPYIFNPDPQIRLIRPTLGDSAGVFGAALL